MTAANNHSIAATPPARQSTESRWLLPMLVLVGVVGAAAIYFTYQHLTGYLKRDEAAKIETILGQANSLSEEWRQLDTEARLALGGDPGHTESAHRLAALIRIRFDLYFHAWLALNGGSGRELDERLRTMESKLGHLDRLLSESPANEGERVKQVDKLLGAVHKGVSRIQEEAARFDNTAETDRRHLIDAIRGTLLALVVLLALLLASVYLLFRLDSVNRALSRRVASDTLTGVGNRQAFVEHLESEAAKAKRYNHIFSIVWVHVDDLAEVNRIHGSRAGDRLLRIVAAVLTGTIRETDFLARTGSHSFGMLLPNTDGVGAASAVVRLRQKLEKHPFSIGNHAIPINAHFSVSQGDKDHCDTDSMLAAMAEPQSLPAKSA